MDVDINKAGKERETIKIERLEIRALQTRRAPRKRRSEFGEFESIILL